MFRRALIYFSPVICSAALAAPLTLTNAAQVRALSQTEAAQKIPVRLRGVVIDEGSVGCVIHDGTAGIYLHGGSSAQIRPLRRRDRVEVTGITDPGGFAPIVQVTQIRKTGTGEIPLPQPATFEQLVSGRFDGQWVEVSGIIRSCEPVGDAADRTAIDLATGGERLAVRGNTGLSTGSLVDTEVRVRAICFNQHNTSRQLVRPILHIPPGVEILVDKPAPADPYATPITAISQLLQFAPEGNYGHRLRLTGTVTFDDAGEFFWFRDGSHGLRVRTRQKSSLRPGDAIEVLGFPIRGGYTPMLEDATFRQLAITVPPAPVFLTNIALALQHDADLVQLEATLAALRPAPEGWLLTLEWNQTRLSASLRLSKNATVPDDWRPGSRVRVTGICDVPTSDTSYIVTGVLQPQTFQLLLRTTDDLQILRAPPWLTSRKIILLASGITLFSLIVAAVVITTARRRLHEQRQRRALAETEFSAILNERNRIAREIHDTLAQGLVATSVQLELVKSELAPDAAPSLAQHLQTAHQLVRASLQEARNSIWNMRSQVLEDGDLGRALEGILKQLTDDTRTRATMRVTGTRRRLAPQTENNLLRAGQEAITNATKHAVAKNITVTLDFSPQEVRLVVHDDGHGFDPAQPPPGEGGFGLVGLKERATQLRGTLTITSAPADGTTITLVVPAPG
ncbi:MAG: hypothetical protein RL380_1579 [Verrucomicrobiota bacterium]